MAMPSVTTAYQQISQWVQQWQATDMAKPLTPLNGSDASNDDIQAPQAEQPAGGSTGFSAPGSSASGGGTNGIDTYA
jgi:hypothetical protein